jgi:hypothetical protein
MFIGTNESGSFNITDIYISELKRVGLDLDEYRLKL